MRIHVIQSRQYILYDPHAADRPELSQLKALSRQTVDETFAQMEQAGKRGSDLVVTTEMLNISLFPGDDRADFADSVEALGGPLTERFAAFCRRYHTYAVAGLLNRRAHAVYNSAVLFDSTGGIVGIYDKIHLTAMERQGVTAGRRYPVFATEWGNIGLLVCWDMQFPEAMRAVSIGGADLVACPTWGWENIYGRCRAYENGVSIAAAMALPPAGILSQGTDPACIVGPEGQLWSVGSRCAPAVVSCNMDIRKEPDFQYGNTSGEYRTMRHLRMAQRRPDTYGSLTDPYPPVLSRYKK